MRCTCRRRIPDTAEHKLLHQPRGAMSRSWRETAAASQGHGIWCRRSTWLSRSTSRQGCRRTRVAMGYGTSLGWSWTCLKSCGEWRPERAAFVSDAGRWPSSTLRILVHGATGKDDMLQQGYPWTPVPCCRIAARRARALILFSRPSPPTWELPPSLPHTPTPQPSGAHSRRCMGLRVGARVSERRPPEFLSAHMRVPSTVNGVLGLNLSLLSRIKAHFCRIWPFIGTTTTGSSLVHRELYCVPACAALRLGGDAHS